MSGHGMQWGFREHVYPELAQSATASCLRPAALTTVSRDSLSFAVIGPGLLDSENPSATLREIVSKLAKGGHLIIGLPTTQEPKHVKFFNYSQFETELRSLGSWVIKDFQAKNNVMLIVAKYVGKGKTVTHWRKPEGKRACIIRYGAIGDLIMVTPLIRALHEDGYAVSMNVSPYSVDAIKHNPYVANVIPHERNIIENQELGTYWKLWEAEYDKYINLSESIEGSLLKIEERRDFYTTKEFREATCNENYLDKTMRLGGYPNASRACELFFSPTELAAGRKLRGNAKFAISWGLNGSSYHKRYGPLSLVLSDWLGRHPDAHVYTLGNDAARFMEFQHPQVTNLAGEISLRDAFSLIKQSDLVVGPESALINAAACFDVPKIALLSHSSEQNLCKHWCNYTALTPSLEVAPCYPCHQMHQTLESCPLVQIDAPGIPDHLRTGPACCMGAITADSLFTALDTAYSSWKAKLI